MPDGDVAAAGRLAKMREHEGLASRARSHDASASGLFLRRVPQFAVAPLSQNPYGTYVFLAAFSL